ncbi:MAG: T9SS type A sorting domain-containing protein [Bacteroidetes bacterium]|nr:T9SS type A sorting domain-containing protein [Bacteroidota bacterium]
MKRTAVLFAILLLPASVVLGQQTPWVSAYYAGWMQSYCPPSAIDYGAVTHIIHFSINPTGGPNIDASGNGITTSASNAIIQAAHAAGKKVLITCGGWGDAQAFASATNSTNRAAFIANLVNFVTSRGYDGLDIDWEPITSASQFRLFIPELRAALDAAKPGLLLTIASMGDNASSIAAVQQHFDQINIMTYDMSGAWDGWVVWHNAPVYDGGYEFPGTNELVPSADGDVNQFVAAGIDKAKIGIGADFYGYVWSGVTQPRQTWSSTPSVNDNVPYYQLMNTYAAYAHQWDSIAHAAYISVPTGSGKFVSLDNERTMAAKGAYVKSKGIGGMIIWELGGGYRSSAPAGQRDVLLQAVKQAFFGQPTDTPDAPTVAGEYRLEQNFPNPFNPETRIRFQVGEKGFVKLGVFDMLGREVARLVSGEYEGGAHEVRFDATGLASGIYFSRLEAGGVVLTKSMALVR